MDLLSIFRTIWRHKLLTVPIAVLTVAGCMYVYIGRSPTWQASVTYVALPPPAKVTPEDLAKDPSLATVSPDNPLARSGDSSIVIAVMVGDITSRQTKAALKQAGVTSKYTAAPSLLGGPTIDLTADGTSSEDAQHALSAIEARLASDFYQLQLRQGVNPYFMYKLSLVNSSPPALQLSSRLRSTVGVLGLGAIGLFIAVSVADAIDKQRAEARSSGEPAAPAPDHDAEPGKGPPSGTALPVRAAESTRHQSARWLSRARRSQKSAGNGQVAPGVPPRGG